ncbi:hypothetical protein EDD21DRAFT_12493 [Dissophora ornata]|nr:hypothetical protein EDD21DRAFT_12493 [Dissophora ornata]
MTPQMPSPIDLENTESLVSQWEFLVPRSDGFLEDGLQGYIQAVRSLKWHEAPMPSLFIILPHYSTQESKPNYDDLLLFWMCEHMDDRAIAPHLDFHPEVYIKRPTEFLDRYGNHVLWSLQIFQQYRVHKLHETVTSKGFTNGNLGIDYDQTIAFLQKRLSISQERIESSIDMMAQHIQERSSAGSTVKQFWEGKNLSRFAAEDLVHLQSFLHLPGMNEARAAEGLSNLRRSVDADGNVHWVCSAHFRKIYPFSIFGQTYLRNIEGPLAIYNANKGQLVVKPSSGVKAREIYGIMQSSPGFVSELCLHIGWKITAEDIAFMYNAVVDSNLSSLSLTGPGDSLASAIRSECILKMLACPRIQSFWLENAGGFLENIVPRVVTGRFFGLRSLRFTLHTTGRATIQDQFWTQILWIVACSPNLKALDISWDEMEKTISVSEILQELSRLPFQSLAIRLKSLKQAESIQSPKIS